jgi:lipid A ethanolaminephosphotransferase
VFHTIADIASISSPYLDVKASLVNASFDYDAPRLYLNDHNEAVVLDKEIGIDESEKELFDRAGVRL